MGAESVKSLRSINIKLLPIILIVFIIIFSAYNITTSHSLNGGDDPGIPLLLTPLIEEGKIDIAQMAAEVYFDGFLNKISYSGSLQVVICVKQLLHFLWFCRISYGG